MRYVIAALFALVLLAAAPSAQAQYCWDTVCAAGTPAADCWRAWCVDGWSYPAYPYRPAGWYRADAAPSYPSYSSPRAYTPYADTSRIHIDLLPTTQAGWCARSYARGDQLGSVIWGC